VIADVLCVDHLHARWRHHFELFFRSGFGNQKLPHIDDLESASSLTGLFVLFEIVDVFRVEVLLGQQPESGTVGRVETAVRFFVAGSDITVSRRIALEPVLSGDWKKSRQSDVDSD